MLAVFITYKVAHNKLVFAQTILTAIISKNQEITVGLGKQSIKC